MRWVIVTALVALTVSVRASAQDLPLLHLKVSIAGSAGQSVPVARHALLISDDPVTSAPRRIVTSADGTAQIRLRPGRYIVESDRPFVFDAHTYEWIQSVEVGSGRDTSLELTAANAHRAAATADRVVEEPASVPLHPATSILTTWQTSAFELWTPHAHATGFLADARGLVATSVQAIGNVTTVEVQISSSVKVTGVVIVADAPRDVAVVRVHPSAVDGIRPVPVECASATTPAEAQHVLAVPLFGPPDVESSLILDRGAAGGPVFTDDGRAVGLSSPIERPDARRSVAVHVVGAAAVCEALASARATLDTVAPPDATRLPVEPARRPPAPAAAATDGSFALASYQFSSSDFDLTFLTPPILAAAAGKRGWTGVREDELNGLRVATDFEYWSEYVAGAPPLLFVRATPRRVESFWMKVARGAASTQGAALPPIKRLRPGFSRMRLLCGDKEVTPIHPFRIQARLTETDAIEEGFYAFDPGAIGPACGTVSIVLSSVKDPSRTETRVVDPAIVRRVWDDFASVRAAGS